MDRKPHFSLTRRAGSFVFVSGQLAFDKDMKIVDGGIEAQTRQCVRNIESALHREGLALDDVVKVMVWLSDSDDFWSFNAAYAELFPYAPPARSTVGSTLMVPGAIIELEAKAWAGE